MELHHYGEGLIRFDPATGTTWLLIDDLSLEARARYEAHAERLVQVTWPRIDKVWSLVSEAKKEK